MRRDQPSSWQHWVRFNFVGLVGVLVQLAVLKVLLSVSAFDFRLCTLFAVEVTVLHNFCWHIRYTWRERTFRSKRVIFRRLLEFHLSNGAVSLAGSWTLMTLLVGRSQLSVIAANLISIVTCSMVNFLLAEVVVFRSSGRGGAIRRRALRAVTQVQQPQL
jgi:putative flippase GtrA